MTTQTRLFCAALGTETNTFAPIPTSRQCFEEMVYIPGGPQNRNEVPAPAGPARVLRKRAPKEDLDVVYGLFTFAQPAGPTTRKTYEVLRDELLADLEYALPVDGVILGLHGAMVANGYDDCEGDILRRVRELVGPDTVIGGVLDPHAHLTTRMLDNSDYLKFYKEYPHTDVPETSEEVVDLVLRTIQSDIRPHTEVFDCRMIDIFHTTKEPMISIVRKMHDAEARDGVLAVSLVHGFPWGDVADMGTKVVVTTDNDPQLAQEVAREIGVEVFESRGSTGPDLMTMEDALDRVRMASAYPVVVADCSDNAGGGAGSDSTFLLRAAIDAGIGNAAFGLVWDPHAVRIACDAGEGETLQLRFGGKTSRLSGDPIDLEVTVEKIRPSMSQTFADLVWQMGKTVVVRYEDIHIVLTEHRIQLFTPEVFESLDINVSEKQLIAVKSTHHFYAAFKDVAAEILHADTPGALSLDLVKFPYRKAPKDIWPFDRNASPV